MEAEYSVGYCKILLLEFPVAAYPMDITEFLRWPSRGASGEQGEDSEFDILARTVAAIDSGKS
jgi:hypothetical protein